MSKFFPRWLSVLIGLVIIVVVSSVVFYSINVMNRVAEKTTVKPHSTASFARSFSINAMSNKNVFLIMMENHNWSDIKNNPSAPYINNTLLPTSSYAEQYYNPPGNHSSEPNYLWLEAGTNFGISDDADPSINHRSTSQHLVTLLSNAGISWKSYQEDISGSDCPLTGSGLYAPKHNPRWSSSMISQMQMIRIRPTVFPIYDPTLNWLQIYNRILRQITTSLLRICAMTCTTAVRPSMIL